MIARKRSQSRSQGWRTAYPALGAAAGIDRAPRRRRGGSLPGMLVGVPLALVGYQLGCALFGHKPYQSPPDSMAIELVALAGVVAPVEELTGGRLVEPRLGIPMTATLFAIKHVAIDGTE